MQVMRESWEVTSLEETVREGEERERGTDKETRCFQNGLEGRSDSCEGPRDTNSLCSNWTTTYGHGCGDSTCRPRAWISSRWIWPRSAGRPRRGDGGCWMLKTGGCRESCVVGWPCSGGVSSLDMGVLVRQWLVAMVVVVSVAVSV